MSGVGNEIYGLAKSLSVMPGDVITMEVYAKYVDAQQSNHLANLTTLLSQIVANAPGVVTYDGVGYAASTSSFPFAAGLNGTASSSGTGPKAYLNWLVFDKNYVLIPAKSGYKRMTTTGREYGQNGGHELLNGSITIDQPGYVYVYLSNEQGANPYEVYFDDFRVMQVQSPIIQTQDYYAFGLTFNSFRRENTLSNQLKYNGKEEQDELDFGWLAYGARFYAPDIARWNSLDPVADLMKKWSPYNYCLNNPLRFIDPDGALPWPVFEKFKSFVRRVDSWFGKRKVKNNPKATTNHQGLDINFGGGTDDYGAPVISTHTGKIVEAKTSLSGNGGRRVTVESPDGTFRTLYFHLSKINVNVGDQVTEGDQIGEIGSSAFDSEEGTASHLHYAIQRKNPDTGEFEYYDPTEGKGKSEENIVDPQKWITGETGSSSSPSVPSSGGSSNGKDPLESLYRNMKSAKSPAEIQYWMEQLNSQGFRANASRPDDIPPPGPDLY